MAVQLFVVPGTNAVSMISYEAVKPVAQRSIGVVKPSNPTVLSEEKEGRFPDLHPEFQIELDIWYEERLSIIEKLAVVVLEVNHI